MNEEQILEEIQDLREKMEKMYKEIEQTKKNTGKQVSEAVTQRNGKKVITSLGQDLLEKVKERGEMTTPEVEHWMKAEKNIWTYSKRYLEYMKDLHAATEEVVLDNRTSRKTSGNNPARLLTREEAKQEKALKRQIT
ncbi:MAG: hypothetical protein ABEJ83_01010 [Candidatus Nanohaloarchaea archaeon]